MPRQVLAQEVNKLVAGLITEASPLTFPENASVDEQNFVLDKDGTRRRRLGIDYEPGFGTQDVTQVVPPTKTTVVTYVWKDAANIVDFDFLVVQVGNSILFYLMTGDTISDQFVKKEDIPYVDSSQEFSFASVDGVLLVAPKSYAMLKYTIDADGIPELSTYNLKMRDTFGIQDDLELDERLPSTSGTADSSKHVYNLRNQGWSVPRLVRYPTGDGSFEDEKNDGIEDPISWFNKRYYNAVEEELVRESPGFPSHSDNINKAVYADPLGLEGGEGIGLDKFWRDHLISSPTVPNEPTKGHFIIDVLQRGVSRLQEYRALRDRYSELEYPIPLRSPPLLPTDTSGPGPSVVGEYAGRAWYGGFTGTVTDGDDRSPSLSSYVFFSQLVTDPTKLGRCYQEGNPTDPDTADLLATDGGFVRLDGAEGIKGFVNIETGLVVIASNGVWIIKGGSDYGFDATNILVDRVNSLGCASSQSIVNVDSTLMYWGQDAIYHVRPNEFGELSTQSLTADTIQSFYNNIDSDDKLASQGLYDPSEKKVRWVYGNTPTSEENMELVLDLTLGAFYPNVFARLAGGDGLPRVLSVFRTEPYSISSQVNDVENAEDEIVYGNDDVVFNQDVRANAISSVKYLIEEDTDSITIGSYSNSEFKDWASSSQFEVFGGVNAEAFIVTGWGPGGDFQRKKSATWVTFHFLKTETGFEYDDDGVTLIPTNQGGCLVQAMWDWTNDASSNRWGTEFQAYRHKRLYIPEDILDEYDDGNLVVSTRNKIRGSGKVLSLKLSTQVGKDLQFLGMSTILGVNGNV